MSDSCLDRNTVLRYKEQALLWILDEITPSDLVKNKGLSSSFERFLRRGTLLDLNLLVSDTISSASIGSLSSHLDLLQNKHPSSTPALQPGPIGPLLPTTQGPEPLVLRPGTLSSITAPICKAQKLLVNPNSFSWKPQAPTSGQIDPLSPSSPKCHSPEFKRRFFELRLGPQQVAFAIKALDDILSSSVKSPEDVPLTLWEGTARVFDQCESVPPIKILEEGIAKIENGLLSLHHAKHLCHLLRAHSIDEEERLNRDQAPRKHICRKTLAYEIASKKLGESIDKVRSRYEQCRAYKHLLKKGGPGSLLQLGTNVSNLWQEKLALQSIDAVLEYRKEYCEESFKIACSLDKHASRLIHIGLIALWTESNIDESSWLMRHLKLETTAPTLEASHRVAKRSLGNPGEEVGSDSEQDRDNSQLSSKRKHQKRDHSQQNENSQTFLDNGSSYASTSPVLQNGSTEIAASVTDFSLPHAEVPVYSESQSLPVEATLPGDGSNNLLSGPPSEFLLGNEYCPSTTTTPGLATDYNIYEFINNSNTGSVNLLEFSNEEWPWSTNNVDDMEWPTVNSAFMTSPPMTSNLSWVTLMTSIPTSSSTPMTSIPANPTQRSAEELQQGNPARA